MLMNLHQMGNYMHDRSIDSSLLFFCCYFSAKFVKKNFVVFHWMKGLRCIPASVRLISIFYFTWSPRSPLILDRWHCAQNQSRRNDKTHAYKNSPIEDTFFVLTFSKNANERNFHFLFGALCACLDAEDRTHDFIILFMCFDWLRVEEQTECKMCQDLNIVASLSHVLISSSLCHFICVLDITKYIICIWHADVRTARQFSSHIRRFFFFLSSCFYSH